MAFPGDELRARRLEAGLTRKDVYRKLHVPVDFVQALEEGLWEHLPSPIYTMGFTRTYCKFLGLNPEPYVDALLAGKHVRWNRKGLGATLESSDRPAWVADVVTWATILALAVLGWVTYTVVVRPDAGQGSARVQAETLDMRFPAQGER